MNGWLAARLGMRSAANVSQTLRRTEWKRLLQRLPRTLAEISRGGNKLNEFAP